MQTDLEIGCTFILAKTCVVLFINDFGDSLGNTFSTCYGPIPIQGVSMFV